MKEKIGWKAFRIEEETGKLWSWAFGSLCKFAPYAGMTKRHLICYNKPIVKGRPWIALFKTRKEVYNFIEQHSLGYLDYISVKKCKYIPYSGKEEFKKMFMDNGAFRIMAEKPHKEFLRQLSRTGYVNCIPEGTIFADQIEMLDF